VKLARPSTRLVLMLHNTRDAHWLDRWVTRATAYVADEWWGDSAASLNERIKVPPKKSKRVISFVTRALDRVVSDSPKPNFIFWGRISPQKGVDRAVRLFSKILLVHPQAKFIVIGPDGGALEAVLSVVKELGIGPSVQFKGELSIEQISVEAASASFYLQTSYYEGMAMSVVEAMQLGLVPVVAPVGEIANYCGNLENAILVDCFDAPPQALFHVLDDSVTYAALSASASATWADQPLYAQSVLSACEAILKRPRQPTHDSAPR
jgi:glycosyltransferase involved in cell wall biosynthesis